MFFLLDFFFDQGVKFYLVLCLFLQITEDLKPKIFKAVISPPIFVDSRKGVRDNEKGSLRVNNLNPWQKRKTRTNNYQPMHKCFTQTIFQRNSLEKIQGKRKRVMKRFKIQSKVFIYIKPLQILEIKY